MLEKRLSVAGKMRPTELFAAALALPMAHGLLATASFAQEGGFDEGWDVMTIQLK